MNDSQRAGGRSPRVQAGVQRRSWTTRKHAPCFRSTPIFSAPSPATFARRKALPLHVAIGSPKDDMARLYVVEPALTITGAQADHRLRLPARDVGNYLLALAKELSTTQKMDLADSAPAVARATRFAGCWKTMDRHRREGSRGKQGQIRGRRGHAPAGVGACARACGERKPRKRRSDRLQLLSRR